MLGDPVMPLAEPTFRQAARSPAPSLATGPGLAQSYFDERLERMKPDPDLRPQTPQEKLEVLYRYGAGQFAEGYVPLRRRSLPRSFFAPTVSGKTAGDITLETSNMKSGQAAAAAAKRKELERQRAAGDKPRRAIRTRQPRSKSVTIDSRGVKFKPIVSDGRRKPSTPTKRDGSGPKRPGKPKKRRPSPAPKDEPVPFSFGLPRQENFDVMLDKLLREEQETMPDFFTANETSETSAENPKLPTSSTDMDQMMRSLGRDDGPRNDRLAWREHQIASPDVSNVKQMGINTLINDDDDLVSAELAGIEEERGVYGLHGPSPGPRADSCPELSIGFGGLRTTTPGYMDVEYVLDSGRNSVALDSGRNSVPAVIPEAPEVLSDEHNFIGKIGANAPQSKDADGIAEVEQDKFYNLLSSLDEKPEGDGLVATVVPDETPPPPLLIGMDVPNMLPSSSNVQTTARKNMFVALS